MLKQLFLGTVAVNNTQRKVFVTVELRERQGKTELRMTGVIGPFKSGNCAYGCGQIEPIAIDHYAANWNASLLQELNNIWAHWHLNVFRGKTLPGYVLDWYDKLPSPTKKPPISWRDK